jgi:hypothetical protein
MVNKPHQLPEVGLAPEVDHAIQFGMVMLHVANLNKLNFSPEMIDHLLVAPGVPPFDCQIILAPGYDDPKGRILASQLAHLGTPGLLYVGDVNVTFEGGWLDGELEPVI